jgi:ATP-dependent protease ClpP protease subunit
LAIHIVHFAGEITGVAAECIRNSCLSAIRDGATDLRLHFSSPGGPNPDSFGLYGFLRSLPVPLITHNIGNVESMSVIVFLAGQRRVASPHSRFLIHPMHWGFTGPCTIDHARFREYLNILDNDLERYAQVFDEQTKGAEKRLNIRTHLSSEDKIIAASDSVACGMAHEIAEAAIPDGAINWWASSK